MNREEIYHQLRKSICELFDFSEDKVNWDTNLVEDLDLDSIDVFDLLSKLEDQVELELIPEEFKDCRTVADVVDRLLSLLDSEQAKPAEQRVSSPS